MDNKIAMFTLLIGSGFLVGCQSGQDTVPGTVSVTAERMETDLPGEQTFTGTGIVRNITPSRTFIIIEHREIEGFMGAMTMPFEIHDQSLLESIEIGNKVEFTLSVSDYATFISTLENIGE